MYNDIWILILGILAWVFAGAGIGWIIVYLKGGFPLFGAFWGLIISFTVMIVGSMIITNIPWLDRLFMF